MTPFKVLVLMEQRMDWAAIMESPIASFAALYYNMNKGNGNAEEGIPAPPTLDVEVFKVFRSMRRKQSQSQDTTWDHKRYGARADRGAWEAFARGRGAVPAVVVKKE